MATKELKAPDLEYIDGKKLDNMFSLNIKECQDIIYGLGSLIEKPTNESFTQMTAYLLNTQYTIIYDSFDEMFDMKAKTTQHNEKVYLIDTERRLNTITFDVVPSISEHIHENFYRYIEDFCLQEGLFNFYYHYTVTEYDDFMGFEDALQEYIDKSVSYCYIEDWIDDLKDSNIYIY